MAEQASELATVRDYDWHAERKGGSETPVPVELGFQLMGHTLMYTFPNGVLVGERLNFLRELMKDGDDGAKVEVGEEHPRGGTNITIKRNKANYGTPERMHNDALVTHERFLAALPEALGVEVSPYNGSGI